MAPRYMKWKLTSVEKYGFHLFFFEIDYYASRASRASHASRASFASHASFASLSLFQLSQCFLLYVSL
jgi:hypothetical protein